VESLLGLIARVDLSSGTDGNDTVGSDGDSTVLDHAMGGVFGDDIAAGEDPVDGSGSGGGEDRE
jgi:hypothetical protein